MRLSLSVNGMSRYVAASLDPGYLSAHLNIRDRPKEGDRSANVRVEGIQTKDTETISLKWPTVELKDGDIVEVRILPEGEGDVPIEIRRSSESPPNLLANTELAKNVLKAVSDFEKRLMELLSKSEKTESPEEHKKFARAIGGALQEHGAQLLYPIYRRHRELVPAELKGEIL
jgi:hypothetical protein